MVMRDARCHIFDYISHFHILCALLFCEADVKLQAIEHVSLIQWKGFDTLHHFENSKYSSF